MNPQIDLAYQYVASTGVSVFLTGKAGTGKTTFLKRIVAESTKRLAVVAPTGVAAVNAGGQTIHSFFQLPLCPYLPDVKELVTEYQMPEEKFQMRKERLKVIRTLELLIIDEISMVRADLLDAIDMVLRRFRRNSRPFGGVQLLMIGDLHQLPPVVTDEERPYMEQVYPSAFFFHSKALRRMPFVTIELQKIYRQQDEQFVDLLNHIRDNKFTPEVLQRLNTRYVSGFDPDGQEHHYIRLTTHNHQADAINKRKLEELHSEERRFEALVEGSFPESSAPTAVSLTLKVGEQVMFVKNDGSVPPRYYNGKIGTITAFGDEGVTVEDEEGNEVEVSPVEWTNIKYEVNPANNEIEGRLDGRFVQVPLRPAWAVTIHKAQGLTFDYVVVDAAAAFTFGQVYVALSRCRTFEGLVLSSPISANCMFGNADVSSFCSQQPGEDQAREVLPQCQRSYYMDELCDLFDYGAFFNYAERMNSLFQSDLRSTYPDQTARMSELTNGMIADLMGVGERFRRQLHRMAGLQQDLSERIAQGSEYFFNQLAELGSKLPQLLTLEVDNKAVAARYKDLSSALLEIYGIKRTCLKAVREKGFDVEKYHRIKAEWLLNQDKRKPKEDHTFDNLAHPELAKRLKAWRSELSHELGAPAFTVLSQKSLIAIADTLPTSEKELLDIPGLGKTKVRRFGKEILQEIAGYCMEAGLGTLEMDL